MASVLGDPVVSIDQARAKLGQIPGAKEHRRTCPRTTELRVEHAAAEDGAGTSPSPIHDRRVGGDHGGIRRGR